MVAPASWAEASCTPPHDLSDQPVVLPEGPAGAGSASPDGGVAADRGALRPRRQPDLVVGPGLRTDDAELRLPVRARRRPQQRGRPRPGPRRADRHRGRRRRRHDRRATTPTTGPSASARSTPWPTAPTCSSSTSRPPTRPATPATCTRRSRALESWDRDVLAGLIPGARPPRSVAAADAARPRHPAAPQDPHRRSGAVPAGRLEGRRARAAPSPRSGVAGAPIVAGHELMDLLVAKFDVRHAGLGTGATRTGSRPTALTSVGSRDLLPVRRSGGRSAAS